MCQYSPWISLFIRRHFRKFLVTRIEMKKVTDVLPTYIFRGMKPVRGYIAIWGRLSGGGRGIARAPGSV
jgi:hypothetical protein